MALTIVWRNPVPLSRTKRTLRRIRSDQIGALYAVFTPYLSQQFELIQSKVA
jgi:hypothetical protein